MLASNPGMKTSVDSHYNSVPYFSHEHHSFRKLIPKNLGSVQILDVFSDSSQNIIRVHRGFVENAPIPALPNMPADQSRDDMKENRGIFTRLSMSPPRFQKTPKIGIVHPNASTNPKKVPNCSRHFTGEEEVRLIFNFVSLTTIALRRQINTQFLNVLVKGKTVVSYFPQEDGDSASLRRLYCCTDVNWNTLQDTYDQNQFTSLIEKVLKKWPLKPSGPAALSGLRLQTASLISEWLGILVNISLSS